MLKSKCSIVYNMFCFGTFVLFYGIVFIDFIRVDVIAWHLSSASQSIRHCCPDEVAVWVFVITKNRIVYLWPC